MRYEKDGLIIENNNPVCDSLYIKQGWKPVKDEPEVETEQESNSDSETPPQEKPVNKRTTKSSK